SFDLRIVAGRWDEHRHVEVVREIVGEQVSRPPSDEILRRRVLRLARLLSFARKERFFKNADAHPLLWQRYDEFLVHSWPPPEPARRARILDAGALDDPRRVRRVLESARSVAE